MENVHKHVSWEDTQSMELGNWDHSRLKDDDNRMGRWRPENECLRTNLSDCLIIVIVVFTWINMIL